MTVDRGRDREHLAATAGGRTDRTVVVGGHLDSVAEGPGINDNGSGTATILETALQMSELGIAPENRVRFAFWSGEEDRLIGSSYYVSQLSPHGSKDTTLNLNFDMVGSPNSGELRVRRRRRRARRLGPERLGHHRGGLHRLLRGAGRGDRTDRLRRPERLLRLHRGGDPGGRPVHGRRGHQVGGAGRSSSVGPRACRTTPATTRPATTRQPERRRSSSCPTRSRTRRCCSRRRPRR